MGATQELFQNQPREQFGTRLTIKGDLMNPQTNLLEVVGNILRNAFIRAYLSRYEVPVAEDFEEDKEIHK